jgi:hypothetical protein
VGVEEPGGAVNYYGLAIGVVMILAVGIGHVVVIRWERHWGAGTWPGMLALGAGLAVASLFAGHGLASGTLGIFGATFLWGVHELFKQRERVARESAPSGPENGG